MLKTYKAILVKDHVLWKGETPVRDEAVDVYITFLDSSAEMPPLDRGRAMVEALQELADLGGLPSIPDPVAWQRETRADRVLPGREE